MGRACISFVVFGEEPPLKTPVYLHGARKQTRVNWPGALIGASVGFLLAVTYRATDFPRPIPFAPFDIVVAAGFGIWLGGFVAARRIAVASTIMAAMVAILAFLPTTKGAVQSLIRRDSIPSGRLDAVIVLSGSVSADSLLNPEALDRLISGLAVFRDNGARLLVTTRSAVSGSDPRLESDADRRHVIDLVADTARWHAIGPVRTTRDEAVKSAVLLLPLGQRHVAVVTSPLHTRRACAAFERVGFQVTCVPADERTYSVYTFNGSNARLHGTADWLYEELAILEYRLRGWL